MARGWTVAGVSFDVADAGGNVQHFDNWTNTYTTQARMRVRRCAGSG